MVQCSPVAILNFLLMFEQGALRFHLGAEPTDKAAALGLNQALARRGSKGEKAQGTGWVPPGG